MTIDLLPLEGKVDKFDLDLSLEKDNMGASSKNIGYKGKGKYDGTEFTFSGPINEVEMKYAQTTKYNHDHQYEAMVF